MLKRIDPTEVTLGMYIHQLEGSWLSHPFWRAKFVLYDVDKLHKLRHSAVDAVIIDISKGCDVAEEESTAAIPTAISVAEPAPQHTIQPRAPQRRRPAPAITRTSAAREFGRAAQVADRGIKVASKVFYTMRLGNAIEAEIVTPVIADVFASIERNPHALNGLLRCKRDAEAVYRHALATCALMVTLARQMQLPPEQLQRAGLAGLLLDIGIAVLPVDVAQYNNNPSAIPQHLLRDHVMLGHDSVQGSQFGDDIARAVLEHHERFDGKGYPNGMAGESLSLLGRMAAICDSYDNLANATDGGAGLDPARALAFMQQDAGAYDPALLNTFIAAMGLYPIGSIVELRSGRLALVVDQGEGDTAPRARVFYSARLRQQVMQDEIDLGTGEDAIVGLAKPEALAGLDVPMLRNKLLAASAAVAA